MAPDRLLSGSMHRLVLALALLSLVGSVVASLYGEKMIGPDRSGVADSYGSDALGHQAFYRLLERLGRPVRRLRRPLHEKVAEPILFIEPSLEVETTRGSHRLQEVIETRTQEGLPTVVVLPKWRLEADAAGRKGAALVPAEEVAGRLRDLLYDIDHPPGLNRAADTPATDLRLATPGLVRGGRARIRVPAHQHLALRWPDDEGELVVIADPDLVHNFNLHRGDHAWMVQKLLTTSFGREPVWVDELFHGLERTYSLRRELGRFPAVLLVIQLLLLGLALLTWGWRRFGPPREEETRTGRGPGEVVAVAGTLLARGQRHHHLAALYLDRILESTLAALGGPVREGGRAERLDRLARLRGVKPLAGPLESARRKLGQDRGGRRAEWSRLVRLAWQFRRDLLASAGGRRGGRIPKNGRKGP